MRHNLIRSLAAAATLTFTAPVALHAQYAAPPPPGYPSPQDQPAAQQQAAPIYDQSQLDQLLAPIALYPDQLLGQILMASTYPLEVVEAARWLQDPNNAALQDSALGHALEQQNWDPSVKSLVPFPGVVQVMNSQLQWTQNLGDAFLAQQGDVMDAVQRLRHEAWNNGSLRSTPQQVVTSDGPNIVIDPANPDTVYVPYYDPNVVYGAWAYPDEPPYYFAPPPGYVYGPVVAGIGFSIGYGVFGPFWDWDDFDWRRHRVHIDEGRFRDMDRFHHDRNVGDTWQHDPEHRRGVAYHDPVSQLRFTRANVNPQELNRGNFGVTNRGVLAPTQPGTSGQHPNTTIQRFQGTPQTNTAPATQPPTVLRGGRTPLPPTGQQGLPQGQGTDQRFRGQIGNQTVVPQGQRVVPQGQTHTVTPQYQQMQPRVVTPPASQNRGFEQNRGQFGNPN